MPTAILAPRAAGDRQEWNLLVGAASQWQACLTNDGDASYSGGNWPSDEVTSLFLLDSLPGGVGAITNVVVHVICRRTNSSLANVRPCIKTGSGEVYSGSIFFSNTTYVDISASFGGGWTVAQINTLQAGAKVGTNFWGTRVTQVYVEVTYTAVAVPATTTQAATAVAATQTTLNGTLVNDGGAACSCGFEWGPTVAYGNITPTQSRTTGQTFAQTITGLEPNKTYHFRAFAANPGGTGYGSDQSFTTPAVLPLAATIPATDIDLSRAMLQGILAYDGGQSCDSSFEWGLTAGYGNETPWQSGKDTGDAFIQVIASLEPDTVYHFRARARNSVGSATGTDQVLRTLKETLEVPGSLFDQSLRLLLEDEP